MPNPFYVSGRSHDNGNENPDSRVSNGVAVRYSH